MSQADHRVSVIMPNFNKGPYTRDAVASVLGQSWPHTELIFIDDHSTDGSDAPAVEAAQRGESVKVLRTPAPRSGASAARNMGIEAASGRYIVFLDSDDLMDPRCIEGRVDHMITHQNFHFMAFPMGVFQKVPGDLGRISNVPSDRTALERFLARDQPWLISGPIWERSFLQQLGGFDTQLQSQQDSDLHIRAILAGARWKYMHQRPSVHYRLGVESIPRAVSQGLDAIRSRAEMLRGYIAPARKASLLDCGVKHAMATYLLDLAQMMRWHKDALGAHSSAQGLLIWAIAHEHSLVSAEQYRTGMAYIRFKHQMLWNRVPRLQARMELHFRTRLGSLIFVPSPTLCKATYTP